MLKAGKSRFVLSGIIAFWIMTFLFSLSCKSSLTVFGTHKGASNSLALICNGLDEDGKLSFTLQAPVTDQAYTLSLAKVSTLPSAFAGFVPDPSAATTFQYFSPTQDELARSGLASTVLNTMKSGETLTYADDFEHLSYYIFSAQGSALRATVPVVVVQVSLVDGKTLGLPPELLSLTSPESKQYFRQGDTIAINLLFSKEVIVAGADALKLNLETGTIDRSAVYTGGSGSKVLSFLYTVQADDSSAALNAVDALSLMLGEGGTVRDELGRNARLTIPMTGSLSLPAQKLLMIDTQIPTSPSSVGFSGSHGSSVTFPMQWAASTDTSLEKYNVKICQSNDCSTACESSDSTLTTAANVTGTEGSVYYGCVQAQDRAGNVSPFVPSVLTRTIDRTPTFSGISAGEVLGSWDTGAGKFEITFAGTAGPLISSYRLFYSSSAAIGSFNWNSPVATVNYGDATQDSLATDQKLLASIPITQLNDGYYVLRFYDAQGIFIDTNVNVSPFITVLKGQPGYALVPRKFSSLAYDYYMMRYEASLSASGDAPGGDIVTDDEANIKLCTARLHENGIAADPACGTKTITKAAQSVRGVYPAATTNFHNAYFACRNATNSDAIVRLPTYEEWNRAARWVGTSYEEMRSLYTDETGTKCNSTPAIYNQTAKSAACKSFLGIYDVAGNVTEWVDKRLARHTLAGAEMRFSYGPTIGKTLQNGIDNRIERRHGAVPSVTNRALVMGNVSSVASSALAGPSELVYIDDTTSSAVVGFRCVAFRADQKPSMETMALPDEPKYQAVDIAGAPASWKIPENFFVKDNKWEELQITVNGNLSDAVAEGEIKIDWKPWAKNFCDSNGACTAVDSHLIYKIYRFIEPNFVALMPAVPWALKGAVSAYSEDKPLDPLAVDSNLQPLYDSSSSGGRLIATISNCNGSLLANCTFTDSVTADTEFSTTEVYNYLMVVVDANGNGNAIYPSVERYRSSYYLGSTSYAFGTSSRMEPRYRRAAVFLVDQEYQYSKTIPQIMVHVPMNESGLDHDFFIQKYEAHVLYGAVSNGVGGISQNFPYQAMISGKSYNNAALCHDRFMQTQAFDTTYCGDGTSINTTTAVAASTRFVSPIFNIDQGAFWKTCRNSGFLDGSLRPYRFILPSQTEWFKAADSGDRNMDGTIDVNPIPANVGALVADLENGAPDNVTNRCNTDSDPGGNFWPGDPRALNCESRYGASSMVGDLWEITSSQIFNGVGLDNGVDGMLVDQVMDLPTGPLANSGSHMDLLRGVPHATGSVVTSNNDDFTVDTNNLRMLTSGGAWGDYAAAGRYLLSATFGTNSTFGFIGGRCSF